MINRSAAIWAFAILFLITISSKATAQPKRDATQDIFDKLNQNQKIINKYMDELKQTGKISPETKIEMERMQKDAQTLGQEGKQIHDRSQVGGDEINRADRLFIKEQYAEADSLYRKALEDREKAFGPYDPLLSEPLAKLGQCYASRGYKPQAITLFRRAIAIDERAMKGPAPNNDLQVIERRRIEGNAAAHLNYLASGLADQGQYTEAEAVYKRALNLEDKSPGAAVLKTGTMSFYADLLRKMARTGEAQKMEAAMRAEVARHKKDSPLKHIFEY